MNCLHKIGELRLNNNKKTNKKITNEFIGAKFLLSEISFINNFNFD